MEYKFNDGGRAAAGYRGDAHDCVVRAIAITLELPYQQTYDFVNALIKTSGERIRNGNHSHARLGVFKPTTKKVMAALGFKWTPTMHIGSGCKVHLEASELPSGRIICSVSKHVVAVIDGVIHDTRDPQREGMRCVYGYWRQIDAASK